MTTRQDIDPELQRRIRRNALMVGGFALLIFVLYIVAVALKVAG
ncbi:MAG: hypothetical protein QG595_282 [Pseudomonadota bacterium]|nr:hypothetical protein [Pseudomonadota bacterium]